MEEGRVPLFATANPLMWALGEEREVCVCVCVCVSMKRSEVGLRFRPFSFHALTLKCYLRFGSVNERQRSEGRVCVKRRREEGKGRNDEEKEKWKV